MQQDDLHVFPWGIEYRDRKGRRWKRDRRGREIESVCGNYGKARERNRVCMWELWKGEGEK
jgi:hypothetical protein